MDDVPADPDLLQQAPLSQSPNTPTFITASVLGEPSLDETAISASAVLIETCVLAMNTPSEPHASVLDQPLPQSSNGMTALPPYPVTAEPPEKLALPTAEVRGDSPLFGFYEEAQPLSGHTSLAPSPTAATFSDQASAHRAYSSRRESTSSRMDDDTSPTAPALTWSPDAAESATDSPSFDTLEMQREEQERAEALAFLLSEMHDWRGSVYSTHSYDSAGSAPESFHLRPVPNLEKPLPSTPYSPSKANAARLSSESAYQHYPEADYGSACATPPSPIASSVASGSPDSVSGGVLKKSPCQLPQNVPAFTRRTIPRLPAVPRGDSPLLGGRQRGQSASSGSPTVRATSIRHQQSASVSARLSTRRENTPSSPPRLTQVDDPTTPTKNNSRSPPQSVASPLKPALSLPNVLSPSATPSTSSVARDWPTYALPDALTGGRSRSGSLRSTAEEGPRRTLSTRPSVSALREEASLSEWAPGLPLPAKRPKHISSPPATTKSAPGSKHNSLIGARGRSGSVNTSDIPTPCLQAAGRIVSPGRTRSSSTGAGVMLGSGSTPKVSPMAPNTTPPQSSNSREKTLPSPRRSRFSQLPVELEKDYRKGRFIPDSSPVAAAALASLTMPSGNFADVQLQRMRSGSGSTVASSISSRTRSTALSCSTSQTTTFSSNGSLKRESGSTSYGKRVSTQSMVSTSASDSDESSECAAVNPLSDADLFTRFDSSANGTDAAPAARARGFTLMPTRTPQSRVSTAGTLKPSMFLNVDPSQGSTTAEVSSPSPTASSLPIATAVFMGISPPPLSSVFVSRRPSIIEDVESPTRNLAVKPSLPRKSSFVREIVASHSRHGSASTSSSKNDSIRSSMAGRLPSPTSASLARNGSTSSRSLRYSPSSPSLMYSPSPALSPDMMSLAMACELPMSPARELRTQVYPGRTSSRGFPVSPHTPAKPCRETSHSRGASISSTNNSHESQQDHQPSTGMYHNKGPQSRPGSYSTRPEFSQGKSFEFPHYSDNGPMSPTFSHPSTPVELGLDPTSYQFPRPATQPQESYASKSRWSLDECPVTTPGADEKGEEKDKTKTMNKRQRLRSFISRLAPIIPGSNAPSIPPSPLVDESHKPFSASAAALALPSIPASPADAAFAPPAQVLLSPTASTHFPSPTRSLPPSPTAADFPPPPNEGVGSFATEIGYFPHQDDSSQIYSDEELMSPTSPTHLSPPASTRSRSKLRASASMTSLGLSLGSLGIKSPNLRRAGSNFGQQDAPSKAFALLKPSGKKRKLVISGVRPGDDAAYVAVINWCENFGSVRSVNRNAAGHIHVDFRDRSVADTVYRVNATVAINGAGSVLLSWTS